MRLVVDTNVLISALLHPGRVPGLVLSALRLRHDLVLYDGRIVAEYRSVLARPKFAFDPVRVDTLIASLIEAGQDLGAIDPWPGALIDGDDRMFVEVAVAGKADVLLTGNAKHYPRDLGFDVMGPTGLLGLLGDLTEPPQHA